MFKFQILPFKALVRQNKQILRDMVIQRFFQGSPLQADPHFDQNLNLVLDAVYSFADRADALDNGIHGVVKAMELEKTVRQTVVNR